MDLSDNNRLPDQVSGERPEPASNFCGVAAVLWSNLDDDDAKAIRGVSRDARSLFDRLASRVSVTLGTESNSLAPSPKEVSHAVRAAIARGTRPLSIVVYMTELLQQDDPAVREQQILALFAACAESPIPTEHASLDGYPHLTRDVAAAVAARRPRTLSLSYDDRPTAPPDGGVWRLSAQHYATLELLQRCLPGLESLALSNVWHWPPTLLHCMCLGTSLAELHISNYGETDVLVASAAEVQSGLRAVCGLRQLKELVFISACNDIVNHNFPDFPNACRLDLACLSGLTSLNTLSLNINQCYQHEGSAQWQHLTADQRGGWAAVWEAQRTGILAAVRCMPDLSFLTLYGMQLDIRPLTALSALTNLNVYGLMVPTPRAGGLQPRAASLPRWRLPPKLRVLTVCEASPTLLASLAPPPTLEYVCTNHSPNRLQFTALDLDAQPDGVDQFEWPRLAPHVVGAMQGAVELLERRLLPPLRGKMEVVVPGGVRPVRPPLALAPEAPGGAAAAAAAAARPPLGGHAPWLSALAPLQLNELTLVYVSLDAVDVRAISDNLTSLTKLAFEDSPFPPVALPFLAALPQLQRLTIDWPGCTRQHIDSWPLLEEVVLPALLHLALRAPRLEAVVAQEPRETFRADLASMAARAEETLAAQGSSVRVRVE
ncbi:hypothetical protein PLESTB_001158700 [Pleodorina starrii]|uniref:Uncharacterized protein n=1 Tax=Pleodorina starrii TaxID=330485 RepID=A0A9W6BRZ8_9CHLO|nr:hypothetical protein PLESTM_000235400 [Pleodorina starrii]GLC56875.1 hypothetical protein PLESTB_001158700 [Pleodorina starrii]GLC64713.1 hypothetical protein PLESTF_000199500 [Pleodorina starrii]